MEYILVTDNKTGNVVFEKNGEYQISDSPNSFAIMEMAGPICGAEIARFSFNRYSYRIQRMDDMEAYG